MSNKKEPAQQRLKHFLKVDNVNVPTPEVKLIDKLNPGMYSLEMTREGELRFIEINHNSDAIVDLPDPVYTQVVLDLETFMHPDTKKRFEEKGYIYKRSSLLWGQPGTGKTVLVNRIANKVIANGGTVLFNPNPSCLHAAFMALDSIQPETMLMVVFEELDELLRDHESALLNVLDGEIQKNNVMYMATTNYINKIPARIRRPGRFSSTMEVKFPSTQARQVYLTGKLSLSEEEMTKWLQMTEGFSIDELSETVRAVYCLQQSLESVTKRVVSAKGDVSLVAQDEPDDMSQFQEALAKGMAQMISGREDDFGGRDW